MRKLENSKEVAGRSYKEILDRFDMKIKDPRRASKGRNISKIIREFLRIKCPINNAAIELNKLFKKNKINLILDHKYFLPAACQGTVGVQARLNDDPLEVFKPINHLATQIECIAERNVLKAINANCNSPISVYAKIMNDKLNIKCDLFDHNGSCLFRDSTEGFVEDSQKLSNELGNKIIQQVGQGKINQLNVLEDDFDYTPKN